MLVWVEAARPKTLVAAIVPVLVGTAAAQQLIPWRLAAALVVALAIQIGVNFANDYFDAVKGVDTPDRAGPRRLTATGLVTSRQMKTATALAFAVAAAAGVALSLAAGLWLIAVGALAFLAALGYSGGPRPYGAAALGEVSVFVFFGVVATVGSAYVQTEQISMVALAASVPVGLLAAAILVTNNLRDLEGDRRAGKFTLPVRLGPSRTRALYLLLVSGAFLALPVAAAGARSPRPLLALLALPAALPLGRIALAAAARLHLIFGLLLAAGLWLR